MSVLIKGIDMPKEGESFLLTIDSDGVWRDGFDRYKNGKAVEVPTPHGDLVDRDVVAENIRQRLGIRNLDYLLETEKPIAMSIKAAPTIIEAEEWS